MSERAVPYQCPYCGDDDLRPHLAEGRETAEPGAWECRSCLRAFRLSLLGHLPRPSGVTR